MNIINPNELIQFIEGEIVEFHKNRRRVLESYRLQDIVRKNPYLQRAKNVVSAVELVESTLDAKLSSSEEKMFGDFFERLAIYVAEKCVHGQKSAARGVDIEFINDSIHYVISVKSSSNWGNSSQRAKMYQDLQNTVTRIKQANRLANVQLVEGICYGKAKTVITNGILKVTGQEFWYLISGEKNLYKDIIEPIGYKAKEHNDSFLKIKAEKVNILTMQFVEKYCHSNGSINWEYLVELNCGNLVEINPPQTP